MLTKENAFRSTPPTRGQGGRGTEEVEIKKDCEEGSRCDHRFMQVGEKFNVNGVKKKKKGRWGAKSKRGTNNKL